MNQCRAKFISLFLVFLVLCTIFPTSAPVTSAAPSPGLHFDGTQSNWAESELLEAHALNLTYQDVMQDFHKNITREEFCMLAVKLYEGLTNKKALAGSNPFKDTTNPEILKAYHLGIVKGISATEFAPGHNITRQEICVMIHRALSVSIPSLDKDISGYFPFADQDEIASWALEAMKFAYKNQIMKGFSSTTIGPLQNTTREQAIVLLKRTYTSYSLNGTPPAMESTISTYHPPLLVATNEFNRYQAMGENNLVFPVFDQKIELYVASKAEKPASKPVPEVKSSGITLIDPGHINLLLHQSIYTPSSYTAFIDKDENPQRWFSYILHDAAAAKEVVWQIASSPFNGYRDNWENPVGLMAKGKVNAAAGEFQIDFSSLKASSSLAIGGHVAFTSSYKAIPQQRNTFYVRAVPVDAAGNSIGEPGRGIAVIYGEKAADQDPSQVITSSFQVWTPVSSSGIYSGENQDRPFHRPVITVDPRSNENRFFHFHGLSGEYEKIAVQISTEPFPAVGGGWPNTPHVIYEKEYAMPVETVVSGYPNSIYVDFPAFAKPASEMQEGQYIKYFLRGVALKDSIEPGIYDVSYSSPVIIEYGYNPPLTWYSDSPYTNTQTIHASLPNIRIKRYTPVKWPAKDYLHYYYVFRAPKANEILHTWKNSVSGELLLPYYFHQDYYAAKGIHSPEDYETKIVPKVLPVGTKVHFPPPTEANKSWYEQLFEGVVNFFKDLVFVAKTLVNQISAAYDNAKVGLITFVVDLCPVESLKGPFATALEGLVNYGLMSLGIPPTLPNFDQLADLSMQYFAEVVLTEAGIPSTEWTQKMVTDLAEGIGNEINKAASYADYNPVDAAFLKLDPDYLYRPAYLDIELSNKSNAVSIAGSFDLHVTFEMDYYNKINPQYPLFLSVPSNYAYTSGAGITAASAYREHFEYGLNHYTVNYSQGDKALYDVYNPQIGIKVPKLLPGETTEVRVYLNPFDSPKFTRYPEGHNLHPVDFENMYFHNGNKKFTYFQLIGRFPSAREYLLQDSQRFYLDPKTDYVFTDQHKAKFHEKIQKPVSAGWVN